MMKCPAGHDNAEQAKFCAKCGEQLVKPVWRVYILVICFVAAMIFTSYFFKGWALVVLGIAGFVWLLGGFDGGNKKKAS